jgi:quinol monooxygenase YgiN
MMSVEVVAEINLVEGKEEEGLEALRQAVEATHAKDAGCLLYALHRDLADPTHLVMVEQWESAELLAAHGRSEHLAALAGHPALAGTPRVLVLEGLGYGDEKGSLG